MRKEHTYTSLKPKECANPVCKRMFQPKNNRQKYCDGSCQARMQTQHLWDDFDQSGMTKMPNGIFYRNDAMGKACREGS